MPLSPDQNKIFDAYDQMFASEGWQMFVEDVRKNQESLYPMVMASASTEKDLYFCKGRNDVYQSILGLQSLMDQVRKQMEEASDEQADSL